MNTDFRSKMSKQVETSVQDYYEVASVDWLLLGELLDKGGVRSHRAIRADQRKVVSKKSSLYKFLQDLYLTSFSFVSYEKELTYSEDESRGYCGYKVISKSGFQVGEIIPGLKGVVATCPQDIDNTPELNYSIFFKEKNSYSLQGPLSFVNHSCIPNCRYKEPKGKSGLAVLEVIRDVEKGDEITVFYGKEYFGKTTSCVYVHIKKSMSQRISMTFSNSMHYVQQLGRV